MLRVACVGCGAEFPCAPSFRGRAPKCPGCRPPTHGRRRDATAAARSAPQNGAAGAPQPSHMTPCACHCAACRAAGHGDGACVVLCAGLHTLFDGKADVVDQILRQYYGACGWGTARFDAPIRCVQYRPGLGDVIAAGAADGRIHVICAQTGEKILCPLRCDNAVLSVAYSPDGTKLAAGLDYPSNSVVVFNTQNNEQICSLNVDSSVYSVAYSPDGTTLTAGLGYPSNSVLILDAQSGKIKSSLRGHGRGVLSVSWSPDATRLASGSGDNTVRIWEVATGKELSQLRGHTDIVGSVCFSSDGKELTSGSQDSTVRNWNPATRASLS